MKCSTLGVMAMNNSYDVKSLRHADDLLKRGFASMLQGGVIMDVVTPDQAAVAEKAGAVSVMALERVPADIRKAGGVARTSHPSMITGIIECTSIPVMAKSRIGHEAESQVLQALGVDMDNGALRLSFVHYTKEEEVKAVIRALDEVL